MTTSTAPHFTVHSGLSTARGLLIATFCILFAASFLIDVQRGASPSGAPTQVELRS